MNTVQYIQVNHEEAGQRLDNFLIRILKGVPKSHIYRMIRHGEVRINKKRAKPSTRLMIADDVRLPPVRQSTSTSSMHMSEPLEKLLRESVLYEDDLLLVINKPPGIAVHGGSGVSLGVIEALRQIRTDLPYLELVHRLDRETSGCLLLAKKRSALRAIQSLLAKREVKKTYWALLANRWLKEDYYLVNRPLVKNILKSGERMVHISQQGKASETQFHLLENYAETCWVEISPKTGRTHQIRVHSLSVGCPVLGDNKYSKSSGVGRLYLHARAIQFELNEKLYHFTADIDTSFRKTRDRLREASDFL